MSNDKKLQSAVMERIKAGEVRPRSRGWFTCLECFIYTFWLVGVLVGAIALAVLFYLLMHGWYSFYELTGMSRFGMVLTYLPLLWVAILFGTVALAYKNFRTTRRGYRYPVWLVLMACIGLSFTGGIIFYALGIGQLVDTHLGERMPMYESNMKYEAKFWHHPEEHRWRGVLADTSTGWVLTDGVGQEWMVSFTELPLSAHYVPQAGAMVHVIGTSTQPGVVLVCAMTHWPAEEMRSIAGLARERELLHTQLSAHRFLSSPCAELAQLSSL